MTNHPVLLQKDGLVGMITLNRPQVFNALDQATMEAMVRAIEDCMEDVGVRAVILTGAGKAFSAGGDMKAMLKHVQSGKDPKHFLRDLTKLLHRAVTDLRIMPKPVVAAINGVASGAGFSYAAACDIRVAGQSARFKQAFTSIGLSPDTGWTAIVPHLVGAGKAAEMLLLDPMIDSAEALELGLVHEVVPDEGLGERAMELAVRLARGPATAFGRAKALLNATVMPGLEAQLERERLNIMAQAGTADFQEALMAFIEKREAEFVNE